VQQVNVGRGRPEFETISLLLQVAQVMAAAHARGMLHMDIKPSNIMVDKLGSITMMDWGLAVDVSQGYGILLNRGTAR
jgi:serine/threonine protein kinase